MKEIFPNVTQCYPNFKYSTNSSSYQCKSRKIEFCFRHVKADFRSMIGEERLNALLLLYIHRDISLDFDKIIDMYASRYPKRMLLINPLSEK